MKRYIKSDVDLNPEKYVGGKLSDFKEDAPIERASDIYKYIYDFSDGYLVCLPDVATGHGRYDIISPPVQFEDISLLFEVVSIKDGVDLIDRQTYLEIVAYNGAKQTKVLLYPISANKAADLLGLANIRADRSFDYDVQQMVDEDIERLGVDDEHYILQGWG